jgi:hypothetical protein
MIHSNTSRRSFLTSTLLAGLGFMSGTEGGSGARGTTPVIDRGSPNVTGLPGPTAEGGKAEISQPEGALHA